MKKTILFSLFLCTLCASIPPVLKRNTSNVCWNNAALQLLRNIKPITEALIEDKQKKLGKYYGKGDDLADAYIDFLEATFGNDQKAIDDAHDKLYSLVCIKSDTKKGDTDTPWTTIDTFFVTFVTLVNEYANWYCSTYYSKIVVFLSPGWLFPQYSVSRAFLNDQIQNMEEVKKNEIKQLPEFFITVENTDKNFLDCSYKSYPFINKYYELVGIIDAYSSGGGHFWAYIRDEFDDNHQWYVRNDLDLSNDKPLNSLPTLMCPVYVLYKKIPGAVENFIANDAMDALANAFLGVKAI